jgi:hypothetical protein
MSGFINNMKTRITVENGTETHRVYYQELNIFKLYMAISYCTIHYSVRLYFEIL